ncbi:MAG: HpcH/HpaI aldolase/citrate lyase family protein [Syntrophales bacterium]
MQNAHDRLAQLVRRSKLYVPVNRGKFVEKAWSRGADVIILDLEDSIAPRDKASARKLVKDVIPIVKKGGAELQVRINREHEEEDLAAIMVPGLDGVMIPKPESAEEIQCIDRLVTQLEKERGFPAGKIYFDLIVETAAGVVNIDSIAKASTRTTQMSIGQADLSVSMGFPRFAEMNFEQYFYAESRLLYAARAAGAQAHGLGAQNGADFADISLGPEAMLTACQRAQWMGFMGRSVIHPAWIDACNEGFKPPQKDLDMARKVKAALDEAYARGTGSVTVDGRMYDVANMRHVDYILARAEAVARREAEKAAALAGLKGA